MSDKATELAGAVEHIRHVAGRNVLPWEFRVSIGIVLSALAAKDAELYGIRACVEKARRKIELPDGQPDNSDAAVWERACAYWSSNALELQKQVAAKDAELAEAKKDSARLEYLINNYAIDGHGERSLNLFYPESSDPRGIIDAAITAASGRENE